MWFVAEIATGLRSHFKFFEAGSAKAGRLPNEVTDQKTSKDRFGPILCGYANFKIPAQQEEQIANKRYWRIAPSPQRLRRKDP